MQMVLRSMLVTAMAASLIAVAAPGVDAHHRPRSYCSSSGDICQSVRKVDGVRKLSLTLAGRYFDDYRLCVIAYVRECKRFQVRDLGRGIYGGRVNFERHFTPFRNASYTVVWRAAGTRIGRKLGFHVGG